MAMATAQPAPPLRLMTSAPLVRVRSKILFCPGVTVGQPGKRKTVHCGAGPDRDHRVAVFAEDEGSYLRGRQLQFLGNEALKAGGVEHRAQTDDLLPRETGILDRQMSQDIDRIRDDENDRVTLRARGFDVRNDLHEDGDVAVDQVEAGLIRFATGAGGDEEDVAVGCPRVVAGVDTLIGTETRSVQEIQGFTIGHILIRIDQLDFGYDS